jgi:GTP-binding protein HflX
LFDRPRRGEAALLLHIERPGHSSGEDLEEFKELVASAGAFAVACVTARCVSPQPRYFVGRGKAEELAEMVASTGAEVVVVNYALSPAQERNLERLLGCRVLDRIAVILDIFAQRAQTFEGKLQVELAQLKHLSTRLVRGWTHLERQKGGIGLRGPGEKQLETDRRLLGERIKQIDKRLHKVGNRRALSRRARRRAELPVVSLVGYTNAGKSTLFNALTGSRVLVEDRLFATLDPTLRRVELDADVALVLADTVGFIRHLPHELVAAFRATLEETRNATLLLHVIDAQDRDPRSKRDEVNEVLREIGAGGIPQLEVYNKIDIPNGAAMRPRIDRDENGHATRVWLSARAGDGISLLHQVLAERLGEQTVERRVVLPSNEGRLRARLFELGTVVAEGADENGGWVMDVRIAPASLERLCRVEGLDEACIAA